MPFAHPQQLRRFSATQPTRLMQPNRIENPGHSDLLQHAIPPAETGQIVCYKTRTYRVSPTIALRGLALGRIFGEGPIVQIDFPGSGRTCSRPSWAVVSFKARSLHHESLLHSAVPNRACGQPPRAVARHTCLWRAVTPPGATATRIAAGCLAPAAPPTAPAW